MILNTVIYERNRMAKQKRIIEKKIAGSPLSAVITQRKRLVRYPHKQQAKGNWILSGILVKVFH